MNHPTEEKWKIDKEVYKILSGGIISIVDTTDGKKIVGIASASEVITDFIENLLEQERKKLVKQIDSFPLSDSMFFDENNWEAGYKALEEFKLSIINK